MVKIIKNKTPTNRIITRSFARIMEDLEVEHSYARRCQQTEKLDETKNEYKHKKFHKLRINRFYNSSRHEFNPKEKYSHKKFNKLKCNDVATVQNAVSDDNSNRSLSTNSKSDSYQIESPPAKKQKIYQNEQTNDSHEEISKMIIKNEESYGYTIKSADLTEISQSLHSPLVTDNLPESIILNIPVEKILEICRYNPNMARQFPQKKRSEKELERRRKNTEACRISRRKRKLKDIARDQIIEENINKYFSDLRHIIQKYFHIQLLKTMIIGEIRKIKRFENFYNYEF